MTAFKKAVAILSGGLILCLPAVGQTGAKSACPVLIHNPYGGFTGLHLHLANQSGKDIMAVKVQMFYLDWARDEMKTSFEEIHGDLIKAGADKSWHTSAGWPTQDGEAQEPIGAGGARIHIEKVLFTDGTSWTPSGNQCDVRVLRDGHGKFIESEGN